MRLNKLFVFFSILFLSAQTLHGASRFLSLTYLGEHGTRIAEHIKTPVLKHTHSQVSKFLSPYRDRHFLEIQNPSHPLRDSLENYQNPWHAFLLYRCQPNALKEWHNGFPRTNYSEHLKPKRDRKHLSFLDYEYAPHTLGFSIMDKWIRKKDEMLTEKCTDRKTDISVFQIHLFDRKFHALIDQMHTSSLVARKAELAKIKKQSDVAMSPQELSLFFLEAEKALGASSAREYVSYPDIAGIPLNLSYENGLLVRAYVDQFGKSFDILDVIKQHQSIPHVLSQKNTLTVKGKAYLLLKELNSINARRQEDGLRPWQDGALCIDSAFNSSGQIDSEVAERLSYTFDDVDVLPGSISTYQDLLNFLSRQGFPVLPRTLITKAAVDLIIPHILQDNQYHAFEKHGQKVRLFCAHDARLFNIVPYTTFLRKPEILVKSVENVKFQVLENGRIVACITVDPFTYNRKLYSHFFIHSLTHYQEFSFHQGDDVQIVCFPNKKPYLYRTYANGSGQPYYFPTECPKCQSALYAETNDNDTSLRCAAHLVCKGIETSGIKQFASFSGFGIRSLTPSLIDQMVTASLITDGSDIFDLSFIDIASLKEINKNQFEKILQDIEQSKKIPLGRFLYALSIPSVTAYMANGLAHSFGTLKNLKSIQKNQMSHLSFLDEDAKNAIVEFFKNPANRRYIDKLLSKGIVVEEYSDSALSICYKDKKSIKRQEYDLIVQSANLSQSESNRSDQEYDLIVDTLKEIEEIHPKWKKQVKIKTRKETPVVEDFINIQKTYQKNVFHDWLALIGSQSPIEVTPKINGVACLIVLNNGFVEAAYTKGGDNKHVDIKNIIQSLSAVDEYNDLSGVIRGELFIARDGLKKVNDDRERSGLKPYVDALSAVVGTINKSKLEGSVLDHLQLYCFGFGGIEGIEETLLSGQDVYALFKKNKIGLSSIKPKLFQDIEEAVKYCTDSFSRRLDYSMDLDGMIVRVRDENNKIMRYGYKFDIETKDTRVLDVSFSMTKSGRLSVIVTVEPVVFNNARTVKRIYVENHQFFDAHPIGVGAIAKVQFMGGVKASLIGSKLDNPEDKICIPANCPVCLTKLDINATSNRICKNKHCKKEKESRSFLEFMQLLGVVRNKPDRSLIIESLVENGLITSRKDLFILDVENMRSACHFTVEQIGVFYNMLEEIRALTPLKIVMALKNSKIDYGNIVEKTLSVCKKPLDIFSLTDADLKQTLVRGQNISLWRKFLKNNESDLRAFLSQLIPPTVPQEIVTLSLGEIEKDLDRLDSQVRLILEQSHELLKDYAFKIEASKKQISFGQNVNDFSAKKALKKQLRVREFDCKRLMDPIDKYLKSNRSR